MGSRNGLHTTTTFLLATSSRFTRSAIVFDGISEEMAQENVLRFGKETSTRMLYNSSNRAKTGERETIEFPYTVLLMGSLFFSSHEVAVYETVPA